MKVLGIVAKTHDTGLALVEDGYPLLILEEERFNREKHTKAFPVKSLKAAFDNGEHDFDDVEVITVPWRQKALIKTFFQIVTGRMPQSLNLLRPAAHATQDSGIVNLWLRMQIYLRRHLMRRRLPPVVEVGHHESHAACFFVSPFDEAVVLVMDGYGDECATSAFMGRGNHLEVIRKLGFFDSLGMLYTCATNHLGFKTFEEGTVMALAAMGEPSRVEEMRQLVHLDPDGGFTINRDFISYDTHGLIKPFTQKFIDTFGPQRERHEPIEQHHRDLAFAVQAITEETVLHLVNALAEKTDCRNLVITGGVGLNCVANGRVLRDTPFERVWVPPCASDTGAPLGSALYYTHHILGKPRVMEMTHASYGAAYGDAEIEGAINDLGLEFEKLGDDELFARVAEDLAAQRIVGWFQGRYEIGPRALGQRSILADPRS
ncbi:MAG: carbamoyltransferase N-terminal domain-containing protein, partial [Pseudomonadota bacterium]